MFESSQRGEAQMVTEPVIDREEAVALLFNVADMARVARKLGDLLFPEDDDGEEEVD